MVLHQRALDEVDLVPADRVGDRLDDRPVYQLLNRLTGLELDWWLDGRVLHISTEEDAQSRLDTRTYRIGALLDAGYDADSIIDLITSTTHADTWAENGGGEAEVRAIGDVLFVSQTTRIHTGVACLLAGLQDHGRQTMIGEPASHQAIRAQTSKVVSADFKNTPLQEAVSQLGAQAGVDIRLDTPALDELGIRRREVVSLRLAEQPLDVVLSVMLGELELTAVAKDGVLLITSFERTFEDLRVAIYDVRDLCRDWAESNALIDAITSSLAPDTWAANGGGEAEIRAARPGTLVVSQTEEVHDELLQLLEMYREALRTSTPREPKVDATLLEVETVYYRVYEKTALELTHLLPQLVAPDSWRSDQLPEAPGRIQWVTSVPESPKTAKGAAAGEPIPYSTLIITQTKSAHREIAAVLDRIAQGDRPRRVAPRGMMGGGGGGMSGGGGGSFGGALAPGGGK